MRVCTGAGTKATCQLRGGETSIEAKSKRVLGVESGGEVAIDLTGRDLSFVGRSFLARDIALYLLRRAGRVAFLLTYYCGEVAVRDFLVFAYVDQV